MTHPNYPDLKEEVQKREHIIFKESYNMLIQAIYQDNITITTIYITSYNIKASNKNEQSH